MKKVIFLALLIGLAVFVQADSDEEKAAQKRHDERDIKLDRERSALRDLLEAIEHAAQH